MQGCVSPEIALQVDIRSMFNQVESDIVVSKRRSDHQRSHTVHECLHEALFLDAFAIIIVILLLFLDKLTLVQIDLSAHLYQRLDSFEITVLHRLEQRCLSIVIKHVDFGAEASILPAARLTQDLYQV